MANLTMSAEEMTALLRSFVANPEGPVWQGPAIGPRRQWVQFATDNIQPPTALYIAAEDRLRISLWTPTSGLVVNVTGRFVDESKQIIPFRSVLKPAGAGARETFDVEIPECFLLALEVDVEGEDVQAGELYANVDTIRGAGTDAVTFGNLIQSPVSSLYHPTWPWSPHTQPYEGAGRLFYVNGVAPGAGNIFSLTIPGTRRWRVRSVIFTLTCDATVAARVPQLNFAFPDNASIVICPANNSQAATQVLTYCYSLHGPSRANPLGTFVSTALPDIPIPNGAKLFIEVENLKAGDTLTNIRFYAEDWPETAT